MKIQFPFYQLTLWGVLTSAIASLNIVVAVADDPPDSVRAQWKVRPEQVKISWDSEKKILEFHLSEAKAIIHGPSNLYEQPYKISFHSEIPDAVVLLKLGDGNPARISGTILKQNESGNPKVYLINKAGFFAAETSAMPN